MVRYGWFDSLAWSSIASAQAGFSDADRSAGRRTAPDRRLSGRMIRPRRPMGGRRSRRPGSPWACRGQAPPRRSIGRSHWPGGPARQSHRMLAAVAAAQSTTSIWNPATALSVAGLLDLVGHPLPRAPRPAVRRSSPRKQSPRRAALTSSRRPDSVAMKSGLTNVTDLAFNGRHLYAVQISTEGLLNGPTGSVGGRSSAAARSRTITSRSPATYSRRTGSRSGATAPTSPPVPLRRVPARFSRPRAGRLGPGRGRRGTPGRRDTCFLQVRLAR